MSRPLLFSPLLLTLFLTSFPCSALDKKNLENGLDLLKSPFPQFQGGQWREQKNCCDKETQNFLDMNQCAIALCGRSGKVDSSSLSDERFQQYFTDLHPRKEYQKFRPKIEEYLSFKMKQRKEGLQSLREKLKNPKDYFDLSSYSDEEISLFIENQLENLHESEIRVDKEGHRKIKVILPPLKGLKESIRKRYIEFKTNQLLIDFINSPQVPDLFESPTHDIFESDEKKRSFLKEALKKLIAHEEESLKEIEELSPFLKKKLTKRIQSHINKYHSLERRIHALKHFDIVDLRKFYLEITAFSDGGSLEKAFPDEEEDSPSFSCKSSPCRDFVLQIIRETLSPRNLKKAEELLAKAQKKLHPRILDNCEYIWRKEEMKKQKSDQIKKFQKKIPTILERVKSRFVSKFSQESQKSIHTFLANLSYSYDDESLLQKEKYRSKENRLLSFFKEEIQRGLAQRDLQEKEERKERKRRKGQEIPPPEKTLLKDYRKINFSLSQKRKFLIPPPFEFCQMGDLKVKSDVFNFKKNQLHISSFSCQHYERGKMAFAHEIGHAIKNHFFKSKNLSSFSRKKYLKLRKCIRRNYKSPQPPAKEFIPHLFDGDTKYVEEDMADFVQSIVFPDPDEGLLSCSLLPQNIDGINYGPLSPFNPDRSSPHSSPFFRLLKEAIQKEKILPPSCQKVISEYRDRLNFEKCLF